MTGTILRLAVTGCLTVTVCGGVGAQPPRSPDELLNESLRKQAAADQRAETTAMTALRDADAVARTNPAKAAQMLRAAIANLEQPGISARTRNQLTTLLRNRLDVLQGRAPVNPPVSTNPGTGANPTGTRPAAPRVDRDTAFANYSAEIKAVQQGIDLVARYQAAGRNQEAEQVIRNLARDYPNNPSVIYLTQKDNFRQNVEDARAFSNLMSDRILAANRAVDRSAIPAVMDVEFPKDWNQRAGRRTNTIPLTEKEKSIIESLAKPLSVSYGGTLEEALQDFSTQLNQPLAVDSKSLLDLGIDLKKGVTLQGKNVPARTVLRQLLGSVGLTFVVKDEVIQVVTSERARDMLVTRVYYLGDVVRGVGPGAGVVWGPYADFQQTMANAQLIVDTIRTSVDPLCWRENGGPCTITFHYPSMSIIVRASAEVHSVLGNKISGGR